MVLSGLCQKLTPSNSFAAKHIASIAFAAYIDHGRVCGFLRCVSLQVDVSAVNRELQSLKPADRGAPDPVSKLWPGHYSAQVQRQQEEGCTPLSDADQAAESSSARQQRINADLKKRFPQFYAQYGYS